MPPAPSCEITWYGPTGVPAGIPMGKRRLYRAAEPRRRTPAPEKSVEVDVADERIVVGTVARIGARELGRPAVVEAEEQVIEPQQTVEGGAAIGDRCLRERAAGGPIGAVAETEP